ncbi:unnamed protein product, partial [Mesorhabditis belari]|uniref:PHD-type domain-containing protein n=1 Tax=Mesorhabditis belari TaxID=2138241 RepID=A0AAF3EI32_9BILA
MASFHGLFNMPRLAHPPNERDNVYLMLTIADEIKTNAKDPKIAFSAQSPDPCTIILENRHDKEEMLCLIYPPLPKHSQERPFAGNIWQTVLNQWRLDNHKGWCFKTRFESYKTDEYKTIILKPNEKQRIDLWADDQIEGGAYSLKVYGYAMGMLQAEHTQINIAKAGSKVNRKGGMIANTLSEIFAKEMAKMIKEKSANGVVFSDVARALDTGATTVPADEDTNEVFLWLEHLLERERMAKPPTSTSSFISSPIINQQSSIGFVNFSTVSPLGDSLGSASAQPQQLVPSILSSTEQCNEHDDEFLDREEDVEPDNVVITSTSMLRSPSPQLRSLSAVSSISSTFDAAVFGIAVPRNPTSYSPTTAFCNWSAVDLSHTADLEIHSPSMVQKTPTESSVTAITRAKREVDADSNEQGPSYKRIYDKDDNRDEDGVLINFIHMSTTQARGDSNTLSDKKQDHYIKKNDGCLKCHQTMRNKACLKCEDGCSKWFHTQCFDTTLHYRANKAKARGRDGKLLCAACRQCN